MNSIKHSANYQTISSNDVLNEIIAMKISKNNAEDALAHARGLREPNLALKAKVTHQALVGN
jgi:hypothetical protein